MKLKALVLDYDGTVADRDRLAPEVEAVLREIRARGIVIVLATGRVLAQIEALLPAITLFDAIVAENGAVLLFPDTRRIGVLARPANPELLSGLRSLGIPHFAGQCVVELDADHAAKSLELIRRLELPLTLNFNRARAMVLPAGVSKANGLREAFRALRISWHNAVAIGDAENDHDMIDLCELGAAVAWGSARLVATADEVVPGTGPADVTSYLRLLFENQRLPPERLGRRRLQLGVGADGRPVELAFRGRNLLIAGEPRSGKSWIAGFLSEQMILWHYCVCIIDPEGDYGGLEALTSVDRIACTGEPLCFAPIEHALRYHDASLVLDLSHMPVERKPAFVKEVLVHLAELRRRTGYPHRIVVDEAHTFLRDPEATRVLDLQLAGYTLVTYRASELDPAVIASLEAVVVSRQSDPHEAEALRAAFGEGIGAEEWSQSLRELRMDEAMLLPHCQESGGESVRFTLAPRLTRHVRHRHKYLDTPLRPGMGFVFTRKGRPNLGTARTLRELMFLLRRASTSDLEEHLRRGDFSRWVEDVLGDMALAASFRATEERSRRNQLTDASDEMIAALLTRYGEVGEGGAGSRDGDGMAIDETNGTSGAAMAHPS